MNHHSLRAPAQQKTAPEKAQPPHSIDALRTLFETAAMNKQISPAEKSVLLESFVDHAVKMIEEKSKDPDVVGQVKILLTRFAITAQMMSTGNHCFETVSSKIESVLQKLER